MPGSPHLRVEETPPADRARHPRPSRARELAGLAARRRRCTPRSTRSTATITCGWSCSPVPVPTFCTGFDLVPDPPSTRADGLGEPAGPLRAQQHLAELLLRLRRIPQPVIAAVNGDAFGADSRSPSSAISASRARPRRSRRTSARSGSSAVTRGRAGRCPRLIGASRASELILTARRFDAHEAERIGLVTRVVPAAMVVDAALDLADELCALVAVRGRDDQGSDVDEPVGPEHRGGRPPREPHADPRRALGRLRRSCPCVRRTAQTRLQEAP